MMSGAPVPVALDPETVKTLIADMIFQCRSPEVIIGSEYGPAGDIWSTACIAYKLATGVELFRPSEYECLGIDNSHIAFIFELLGPIPPTVFKQIPNWKRVFYKSGKIRDVYRLKPFSLYEVLSMYWSKKNTDKIFNFLLPMFEYDQKKRATTAACLQHPWLQPQTPVARKRVSKDSGKLHEDKDS